VGKLVLYLADGSTLDVKLDRERIMIGRRADNDVCLPYPAVSGEHAVVITIFADSFLEDLGSTNGTTVNGKSVTKHFLRDSEEIEIGRQRLVYVEDDARMLAPAPPPAAREGRPAGEKVDANRQPSSVVAPPARPASEPPRSPPAEAVVAMSAIERFIAAELRETEPESDVSTAKPAPEAPAAPAAAVARHDRAIRVATGPNAGREVVVNKDEILVGRIGLQIVAVRRSDAGLRVVPVEGDVPPRVNGAPVTAEGMPLDLGDVLEVAGVQLTVVPAGGRDSA
jgi:FHA domain-containing protein